ncbi:MAG: hypothetical protein LBJ75_02805 [Puniceicoccales bacterium]|jgi:uncharacterized protein YdaT|nr:hypothetical protein [Puniceicoccales bacterium]
MEIVSPNSSAGQTETKYIAKVMYGDDNIKGEQYYAPNAKIELRAWYGRKTREEINTSVMQEFAALRLAKISKDMWKSAFAISVDLLNDQDVNKGDNIGIVSDGSGNKRMCLFDLGHPTPDKFELDPNTFLPKSTNLLADVLLWVINIFVSANNLPWTFTMVPDVEKQLSPEERKEALSMVLGKKDAILQELDSMIQELEDDPVSQQAIRDLKVSTENRMEYLQELLHPPVVP